MLTLLLFPGMHAPFVVSLQDGALELHHQNRKDVAPESVLQKISTYWWKNRRAIWICKWYQILYIVIFSTPTPIWALAPPATPREEKRMTWSCESTSNRQMQDEASYHHVGLALLWSNVNRSSSWGHQGIVFNWEKLHHNTSLLRMLESSLSGVLSGVWKVTFEKKGMNDHHISC